jgi:signal transduction histidine kinase
MVPFQHDLVSSLYAAKGMLELLIEERNDCSAEEKTVLKLKRSEAMLKRAHNKLDTAFRAIKRINSVDQPPHTHASVKDSVSIFNTWYRVIQTFRKKHRLARVELIERIPSEFPGVQVSQAELDEIFYLLIDNALEAMNLRGKLVLRAQIEYLNDQTPYAVICLSDTGPGIPDEQLPHLFRPFFTTKPESVGNGLGLYLTKTLVTRNQGRIHASSAVGYGTTFTLELPL